MISYSVSGNKLSAKSGHDSVTVTFSARVAYESVECRATKAGEPWGEGVGTLLASFSYTPQDEERSFAIYDDDLVNGDGLYQITFYMRWKVVYKMPFGFGQDPLGEHTIIVKEGEPIVYKLPFLLGQSQI